MVRRCGQALFGHTTVWAQLGWCVEEGVPEAIFTHCGSGIIGMKGREAAAKVRALAEEHGVTPRVAYDGMVVELRCA
jgi:hypothetical protein